MLSTGRAVNIVNYDLDVSEEPPEGPKGAAAITEIEQDDESESKISSHVDEMSVRQVYDYYQEKERREQQEAALSFEQHMEKEFASANPAGLPYDPDDEADKMAYYDHVYATWKE